MCVCVCVCVDEEGLWSHCLHTVCLASRSSQVEASPAQRPATREREGEGEEERERERARERERERERDISNVIRWIPEIHPPARHPRCRIALCEEGGFLKHIKRQETPSEREMTSRQRRSMDSVAYVRMYVCMHVCVHTYIHTYIHTIYTHIYTTHTHTHTHTHTNKYIYTYIYSLHIQYI